MSYLDSEVCDGHFNGHGWGFLNGVEVTQQMLKIIMILTVKDKNATVQNCNWLTESFRTICGK